MIRKYLLPALALVSAGALLAGCAQEPSATASSAASAAASSAAPSEAASAAASGSASPMASTVPASLGKLTRRSVTSSTGPDPEPGAPAVGRVAA